MPTGKYVRTGYSIQNGHKSVPRATVKPTYGDIRQAVGFIEGEGSFSRPSTSQAIQAVQKQDWPLLQLQQWFGGSVRYYKDRGLWIWLVTGPRARGVMMTLYQFLSPRRKEQIRKVLAK